MQNDHIGNGRAEAGLLAFVPGRFCFGHWSRLAVDRPTASLRLGSATKQISSDRCYQRKGGVWRNDVHDQQDDKKCDDQNCNTELSINIPKYISIFERAGSNRCQPIYTAGRCSRSSISDVCIWTGRSTLIEQRHRRALIYFTPKVETQRQYQTRKEYCQPNADELQCLFGRYRHLLPLCDPDDPLTRRAIIRFYRVQLRPAGARRQCARADWRTSALPSLPERLETCVSYAPPGS